MRRQFWSFALLFLVPLTLFQGCTRAEPVWKYPDKKHVVATFPPIYCFVQSVAGDDVEVVCLLTASGPHENAWTTRDMMKIREADLVFSNGLGLDDKIVASSSKKVPEVKLGDDLDKNDKLRIDKEYVHGDHVHKKGATDPHVWLSPLLAVEMVDRVADELSKLHPAARERFHERAKKYKAELKELYDHGVAEFKNKKSRKIVTHHDSFGYFAKAFNLEILNSIRLQNGIENNARDLAQLVEACKEKQVAVITYEPQYLKREAEMVQTTLKKGGYNLELAELDPLETATGDVTADYYLKKMRENIDNLARALP
jgi:zinc transport system substrate-binding protein